MSDVLEVRPRAARPAVARAEPEPEPAADEPGRPIYCRRMGSPAIAAFATPHLPGVLALCEAEGWPSLPSDPARAVRILTGDNAQALVALDGDDVIGFAFAILDAGLLDAYLSMFAVAAGRRREGIGRLLIDALFRVTGVERIDLLAEPGSEAFYDSFRHRDFRGYRLHPGSS